MILFKNSAATMEGVLENQMHATDNPPRRIRRGDIILIAQTKSTLKSGQKPIRWVMDFVNWERDTQNRSDQIWGRHWNYLIIGENVRSVEPFDIGLIKNPQKNYNAVQTFAYVDPIDIAKIQGFIDSGETLSEHLQDEFDSGSQLNHDQIIFQYDQKYSAQPEYKKRLIYSIQRPSALSNAIKRKHGYKCQICGYPGFTKRGGSLYAETHHMVELNNQAPLSLQSWNLLVVCPLCHKKLHYGQVETKYLNPGWEITLDNKTIRTR